METEEPQEINYETREYDGIKWIRYDHYVHAIDLTEKATRERDIEVVEKQIDKLPMSRGMIRALTAEGGHEQKYIQDEIAKEIVQKYAHLNDIILALNNLK